MPNRFEASWIASVARASLLYKGVVREIRLSCSLKTKEMIMPGIMSEDSVAGLAAQGVGRRGDRAQDGGSGAKQDAVDNPLVLEGNGSDLVWNGEDDVKIGNRQKSGDVLCQPF